ncbi:hypothetical protein Lepto7375DRAFT_5020 [Leptolyngbya sp. PCC 7375]|nr:hypothetical protein Lepto7375DRAFT_5020 [Leptolyngbya sp. PCC 7375]
MRANSRPNLPFGTLSSRCVYTVALVRGTVREGARHLALATADPSAFGTSPYQGEDFAQLFLVWDFIYV